MQRPLEIERGELRQERERGRDEALHVGRAPAVEPVPAEFGRERIARPVLAVDRHDIAMPGQHKAAVAVGAERREQVRLAPLFVLRQPQPRARGLEQARREGDQIQIGISAHRVECNQPFGQLNDG